MRKSCNVVNFVNSEMASVRKETSIFEEDISDLPSWINNSSLNKEREFSCVGGDCGLKSWECALVK